MPLLIHNNPMPFLWKVLKFILRQSPKADEQRTCVWKTETPIFAPYGLLFGHRSNTNNTNLVMPKIIVWKIQRRSRWTILYADGTEQLPGQTHNIIWLLNLCGRKWKWCLSIDWSEIRVFVTFKTDLYYDHEKKV